MHLTSMDSCPCISLFCLTYIVSFAVINFNHENTKVEKRNKTKTWVFEKINKTDKPLSRLTKKKVSKLLKSGNRDITTNPSLKTKREYYELFANIFNDLDENDHRDIL